MQDILLILYDKDFSSSALHLVLQLITDISYVASIIEQFTRYNINIEDIYSF